MRVDEKALQELARIYEAELGDKLDRRSAEEMASRLLVLYGLLAQRSSDRAEELPAELSELSA